MFAKPVLKFPILLQLQGAFLLFPVPLQLLEVSSICSCLQSAEKKWALFATSKQFLGLWLAEWMLDIRALQLLSLCSFLSTPTSKSCSFLRGWEKSSISLNQRYFVRSRCCHRDSCWSQGLWQWLFKNHADKGANLALLLEDNSGNIFFYHSEDKHVFVYWFFLTFCFVASWLKQLLYSETSNLAFSKCFFWFFF